MPELPEVETVRRTLEKAILGKRILSLDVYYPKMIHHDLASFEKSVQNAAFIAIGRRGKYLLLELDNGKTILSHLRMEGRYRFEKGTPDPVKHDLLRFRFSDGASLFYHDVRKFGVYELFDTDKILQEAPLSLLGPEPFDMSPEALWRELRTRKGPIKEALLDQSLIAGIGNIYADESLYASKIHPLRPADSLSLSECETLLKNAQSILKEAILLGGSTVRSYHPSEGIDGKMQTNLLAYGRVLAPCSFCGLPLKKIRVGGRGTTYCPHCQKDPTHPYVIGVSGPIASGKSTLSQTLEEAGYAHFDADKEVALLYRKPAFLKRLAKRFGPSILDPEGALDRKAFLNLLDEKPELKKELEALVHPLIYKKAVRFLEMHKGERVVLDVPLLFDSPFEALCDATILVTTDPSLQRERIALRGKDVEKSLALNASYPLEYARKHATLVFKTSEEPIEKAKERLLSIPWLR